MAKDKDAAPETPAEEESGGGGGMKKMIIFGVVVLLAVGGSVAGTIFYMQANAPAPEVAEEVVEEEAAAGGQAFYHNMRPPFVVNFMAGDKARLLQAELTIMSRDQAVMEAVVVHTPLLRNKMINLLTDQDYLELQTHEGKQALREQARRLIDTTLEQEAGVKGVESVLLNAFVMQ